MEKRWNLTGHVLVACNCDWGCPCNFNARPTAGKCEGGWTWHVDAGAFDGVSLDGLNFSVYVNWPGAIHEGNGVALILIDDRSTDEQRQAITRLIEGKSGGPWGILGWTWPTIHGPFPASYDFVVDGVNTRLKCGDYVLAECSPIRNPVSGAEVHPGVVLPEGLIMKKGDVGMTTSFRVSNGIEYDHSGKYMALGPFEYSGVSAA